MAKQFISSGVAFSRASLYSASLSMAQDLKTSSLQFYEAFLAALIGSEHFLSPPYSPSKIRSVISTAITKSNKISSDFRDQGVKSGF